MFPTFGWFLLLALVSGMIRDHDPHRRHPGPRRAVASHPATATDPTTPLRRPPPRRRPRSPGRHRLPAAQRHPLAAAADRPARLRQRDHLLAAAARLATRWRLRAAPPPAARPARPRQPPRLVPRQPRLPQRARQTGGELTGPNPTDRGKLGTKYHLLVDRGGIPLAVRLSAANTHDSVLL